MKVFAVLLLTIVALAGVFPSVSGIWVRSYSDGACALPSSNLATPSAGSCAKAPEGTVSYIVTCDTTAVGQESVISSVTLRRWDQSRSCDQDSTPAIDLTVQVANEAGVRDAGVYNGSTCLVDALSGSSFRVYCDETIAADEQSKLAKQTVYDDAKCSTPSADKAVTSYSAPLGACTVGADGKATATYLVTGAVVTWQFSGTTCVENAAVEVQRRPLDTCVGHFDDVAKAPVYSRTTSPSVVPTTVSPTWTATFPPQNSAVHYSCPSSECLSNCFASGATVLGRCTTYSNPNSAKASYCLSTGHFATAGWSTSSCSGSAAYVAATYSGAGACTYGLSGSYTACPGVTGGAPSVSNQLSMTLFAPSDMVCTKSSVGVTMFREGACLAGGAVGVKTDASNSAGGVILSYYDLSPIPNANGTSTPAPKDCSGRVSQTSPFSATNPPSSCDSVPEDGGILPGNKPLAYSQWQRADTLDNNGYISAAAGAAASAASLASQAAEKNPGTRLPSGGDPDASGQGSGIQSGVSAASSGAAANFLALTFLALLAHTTLQHA